MPKWRLVFDGDNQYIEKEARIYKLTDEIETSIDNIPWVINDLNSSSTTDALSAAMGKYLEDQIIELQWSQSFLSTWDCTTGLPATDPATNPYEYKAWNYYIVAAVAGSWWTNYKPHWSSYTAGVASTAVETETVEVWDWYLYDGRQWVLQKNSWTSIVIDPALSSSSRNPVENRAVYEALQWKQDTISDLTTIRNWAAAWATAIQPWDNITELVNNAWYQTAWDVATAIADIAWDINTKTFYLANASDTTTAQQVWDRAAAWKNAIVYLWGFPYFLEAKSATRLTFYKNNWWMSQNTPNNTKTWFIRMLLWIDASNWTVTALNNFAVWDSWAQSYLATDVNYSTPYTPLYDGSPATKKYVDDKIYTWATAPANPDEWMLWYDTTNDVLKVCDGSAWIEVGSWWTVVIPVTVSSTSWATAKVGTTTGWDYTPTAWDILLVTFTNWYYAGNATLNIDGSWAKYVKIGSTNVTADRFELSAWWVVMMYYDWTAYQVWSTKNTTYWAMSQAQAEDWTSTSSMTISPATLKYAIETWWGTTYTAWTGIDITNDVISVDDTVWTDNTIQAWDGISITKWVNVVLPTWYTPVEYLESSWTQYIDTFIQTQAGIWFDVDYMTKSQVSSVNNYFWCVLWARQSSGTSDLQLTSFTQWASTPLATWWTVRYWTTSNSANAYMSTDIRTQTKLQNLVVTTAYYWWTQTVSDTTFSSPQNIYLFWLNQNWTMVQSWTWCRIYSAKILVWDTVVAEMYPCTRDSDDEPGMYDVTNSRFLTNAWTWDFIVWNVLSPKTTISTTLEKSNVKAFFLEDVEDTATAWEILSRYVEWVALEEDRYPVIYMGDKTYLLSLDNSIILRSTTTVPLRFVSAEVYKDVVGYSKTEIFQEIIVIAWTVDDNTFEATNVTIERDTNSLWLYLEARSDGPYISPYTPTYNGDPATKKYVDDKMYSWTTAPSNPTEWQLWYDTTNDKLKVYDWSTRNEVGWSWGRDIINVTVNSAYNATTKVGTTTAWSYTPTAWDLLLVNFVNGTGINLPTLNIDGSWAKSIYVWSKQATTATFNLWTTANSNVKVLMYYDGTYYKAYSTDNNQYSNITSAEISAGTSTTQRTISAALLKEAIETWAPSGWASVTQVTVSTAYGTAAKVGTTTAGNYTPTAWDLLLVNFVNWCSVTTPTLNIDGSWAHNIRVGNSNASSTYFSLWTTSNSNVKVLLWYDGTYYRAYSTVNTTYTSMSATTATSGTSTTANTISASVLKQAIQAHAITLADDSPLDIKHLRWGTEAQYAALSTKDDDTAYLCV